MPDFKATFQTDKPMTVDFGDTNVIGDEILIPGPQGPQGPPGEPGKDGYTPIKGVDYFTPDEVQEIAEQAAEMADYELPIATPSKLGGVKPAAKGDDMTQPVGVDTAGGLWTVPAGGAGEEVYELVASATIEEAVNTWEYNFKDKPMKKIWVYLETPAHTTDTNYTSINVSTDGNGASHFRNKTPYIYPVPRKNACKQEIFVEVQKRNGEYALVFHNTAYTSNSLSGLNHGLITSYGADNYGYPLNGKMTSVKLFTYQIFDVGAKIQLWGVRA